MLSDKDRELIGIGASIAAGCQPCTNFHLRAARIAGANDAEIRRAVNYAVGVARHAAEAMAELAVQHAGAPSWDMSGGPENPLLGELVSISAAFALHSISDLETHLTAARQLGATQGQILSVIKIARAVKVTAEGKAEESAGRTMRVTSKESEDCCNRKEEDLSAEAARATALAGRAGTGDCGPQCGCHSNIKKQE